MTEFKFTPLEVFEWWHDFGDGEVKLIGQYHPGMTYNCTKELRHTELRKKCYEWEKEGKIQIIPLKPGQYFQTIKP